MLYEMREMEKIGMQFRTPSNETDHLLQHAHTRLLQVEEKLRDALQRGQNVIEQVWSYNTRAWATSVHAADIDGDGDCEILVGLRDGRVCALTKHKALKWATPVLDNGEGIETVIAITRRNNENQVHVIAGSRGGMVFGLKYHGELINSYQTEGTVRHIYIDPEHPDEVIVGCDDHCVYVLDCQTLQPVREKFLTGGSIRCVFSYDIDGDGENEIFAASSDLNIYVISADGKCRGRIPTKDERIYTIFVAPLENGDATLLAGTSSKKLIAWSLSPQMMRSDESLNFQVKPLPFLQEEVFESCIRSLFVSDINKDDFSEILVATEDRYLYILDRFGKVLWKHFLGQFASTLFAIDIDLDGAMELLVGMEDNNIQLLRIELDHQNEAIYEHILDLYKNFSRKERQLLYHLVGPQKYVPHYYHMEWHRAKLLIAQREYEEALSLLLQLRQQSFQHFWSASITCNGSIRVIDSGNHSKDAESELVVVTDNGDVDVIDVKPSIGNRILTKPFSKGVYRLATLTNLNDFDRILVALDDHVIYLMDHEGTIQREFRLENSEDIPSTIYVHKEYCDREADAASEVIVGLTNGKVLIYDNDLSHLITSFETGQEIRMLCSSNYDNYEIITASRKNHVCLHTREGVLRWQYTSIRGRVRALHIRDIDGDGHPEIIVGSEDCSVYVLNHEGHLKWRYLTPHRVLAVEVADIDGDKRIEILVGSENGLMYILDSKGDLLGTYDAGSRITAIHAQDLHQQGPHPDGIVEIAIAADRQVILLQALHLHDIIELIDQCWKESQEIHDFNNARRYTLTYTKHKNPGIHVLALAKLAGSNGPDYTEHIEDDLRLIEEALEDKSIEVRLELARIAVNLARSHEDHQRSKKLVRAIFQKLSSDPRVEVKLTVVERLPKLQDTSLCFEYFERLIYNEDVLVRRAVIRKLDTLIEDYPERVFSLLLKTAKASRYEQDEVLSDDEREWIYQEVGRSLAHYFSAHQKKLFEHIQDLVAQGSSLQVIQQISYSSPDADISKFFGILTWIMQISTMGDEDERNTQLEHQLDRAVKVLCAISQRNVNDSEGILQIYRELRQLFRVKKVDDIEQYQWIGDQDLLDQIPYTSQVSAIFTDLSNVIEHIRRYRKRQLMGERLTALIQAYYKLKTLHTQIEQAEIERLHVSNDTEHPLHLTCPPEDHIFLYILNRWMKVVFAEIERVRGKATLRIELKCGEETRLEERVVLSLQIANEGRCPADSVHVRLEESPTFIIVGSSDVTIDEIGATRSATIEFTIRPFKPAIHCAFQINYTDAEGSWTVPFASQIELQAHRSPFKHIPDKYRAGMPLTLGELDRALFFGRKKDITFLLEKLTSTDSNSMVVFYGQRRSGKTSLLYRLMSEIRENSPHLSVLIDLQAMALTENVAQLLGEIASSISACLEKSYLLAPLSVNHGLSENPTSAFDSFLKDVLQQIAPRKLILLIDEFEVLQEKIEQGKLPPMFLKYLRSLVQHQHGISFLLASAAKINRLTESYLSAFFNIAYIHKISKLEAEEAENLITIPVIDYLKYDRLALEKLHHLTNDQPYLIHLMSTTLIRHCNKKRKNYVTVNDVNVVCDQVIHTQGNHFQWIWNLLQGSPAARLILSLLAQGDKEERFSIGAIHTTLMDLGYQFPKDQLLSALQNLVEEEFVSEEAVDEISDGIHCRIPVGLTRAWLRTVKPPEWIESEVPREGDDPTYLSEGC